MTFLPFFPLRLKPLFSIFIIYLIKDCIYIELLKHYLPGLNCHLTALFYGRQFINVCHNYIGVHFTAS